MIIYILTDMDDSTNALDNGEHVIGTYLDFSKAQWIISNLSNRS